MNTAHLEPVTDRENILRGEGVAAVNAAKTRCINGHAFEGHNLIVEDEGHPQPRCRCRECRNEASRRYRQRKAARL